MIDENFQDMVLACMIKLPEFNAVSCPYLSPEYFDGALRKNLAKMMIDFWNAYGTVVSDRVLVNLLKDLSDEGKIEKHELMVHATKFKQLKALSIMEWKYILDKLVAFIKHQKIKALIEESVKKHLPKGNYEQIEREMAKIAGISANNRIHAYDYFDEKAIRERTEARREEMAKGKRSISTGIPELDAKLHANGFYEKELYIFMAPPKCGKSMSLLWFSNQAAIQGYNVAHFSCEVSKEICSARLDAMNSKTMIRDIVPRHDMVASHLASVGARGKLLLFEYPTKTLTPQMIEAQLERMRTEHGIVVDMVVVDYLDIMRMPGPKGESSWADQGPLAQELRGIAGKYVLPVVTATQVNRQGAKKSATDGSDVAGDYEKIMIADEIFSMNATEEELKENILRVTNCQTRNSEKGTIVINTKFAYGQFYGGFVETGL